MSRRCIEQKGRPPTARANRLLVVQDLVLHICGITGVSITTIVVKKYSDRREKLTGSYLD